MNAKPSFFSRFAKRTSDLAGSPHAFALAVLIVLAWGVTGPIFGFSDTWQLIINTGTTIATFLMVFLMQNTQNRDTRALQVKLDELIRAHEGADNQLLDLEDIDPAELEALQARYERLAEEARTNGGDKSTPDLD
jgi:low affinity Fe/Cu permease